MLCEKASGGDDGFSSAEDWRLERSFVVDSQGWNHATLTNM